MTAFAAELCAAGLLSSSHGGIFTPGIGLHNPQAIRGYGLGDDDRWSAAG